MKKLILFLIKVFKVDITVVEKGVIEGDLLIKGELIVKGNLKVTGNIQYFYKDSIEHHYKEE